MHRRSETPSLQKTDCLRGVDGKYIQLNEFLKDVLNGKLKLVQNKNIETNTESEKGEIEDKKSDIENHDTSKREGYRPNTTWPEDEFNLHTDGELLTGEKKENLITTENQKTRRSNRESKQPNRYGG